MIDTTHNNMIHLFFGSPTHKNYKVECACLGAILGWVTSWEVFPGNARVRAKRAGKTNVVTVRPVVKSGCYKWYQSGLLPVRCGSGTNQAEDGGPVTRGRRGWGVIAGALRHGQGTAPSRLLGGGTHD